MCPYLDGSRVVVHVVLRGSQTRDALQPSKLSQEHFGSPRPVQVSAAHPDLPVATLFLILILLQHAVNKDALVSKHLCHELLCLFNLVANFSHLPIWRTRGMRHCSCSSQLENRHVGH